MFNEHILYKVLRYLSFGVIIYLLLRYFPYSKLSSNQSLFATIIILIISFSIELFCIILIRSKSEENLLEKFDNTNNICKKCTIEKCEQKSKQYDKGKISEYNEEIFPSGMNEAIKPKEINNNKKEENPKNCRIVCDYDDETKNEMNNETDKSYIIENSNGEEYKKYNCGDKNYDNYNKEKSKEEEAKEAKEEKKIHVLMNDNKMNKIYNEVIEHKNIEKKERQTKGYDSRYQEICHKSEVLKTTDNNRSISQQIDNELPYSDYNHLPVAAGYKSNEYEYGYSFIPPEKWYPHPLRPPICLTEKRSNLLPVLAHGTPADAKEWHDANRITGSYRMNVDYVKDKLNSGV